MNAVFALQVTYIYLIMKKYERKNINWMRLVPSQQHKYNQIMYTLKDLIKQEEYIYT